jgi:hypothetical protein
MPNLFGILHARYQHCLLLSRGILTLFQDATGHLSIVEKYPFDLSSNTPNFAVPICR